MLKLYSPENPYLDNGCYQFLVDWKHGSWGICPIGSDNITVIERVNELARTEEEYQIHGIFCELPACLPRVINSGCICM